MAKRVRENRVVIMFSDDELEEIDAWQHDNRLPTRAAAVRLMLLAYVRKRTVKTPRRPRGDLSAVLEPWVQL